MLALLILAATFAVPAALRFLRVRGGAEGDRAQLLLELAVRGLPAYRADWARAMLVELDQVEGRQERWQFSLGCARAAVRIRVRSREPGGALLRVVVLGCTVIALALVGYGLVQYPGLRSAPDVWGATIVFLLTLLIYAALTVLLSRGEATRSVAARRYGLAGPYDSGLVSDFHKSDSPDLATYAVSDNLGSGLVLLLMIPTVAFALGSLGARLSAATRRG